MVKLEKLYEATNGGLDIIVEYFPSAKKIVDGDAKKFKMREGDRTPSASLHERNGIWKVTDFGDAGHELSPIDIVMEQENCTFGEAVLKMASRFNVPDELDRSVNKPDVRKMQARQDQEDGRKYFEFNERFTDSELKILGPNVTQEVCERLHWYSVKWVCDVKNREATYKYSNENYPIFMRECLVQEARGDKPEVKFYKQYEPLNPDKAWRFSYTPKGVKPKLYINGFSELKKRYAQYNAEEEAEFRNDPANENKPYKEKKLPEAFICSGERDSLCCAALGYLPLWFNSETYNLSEGEYRDIMKYVEVLYNIPDLDDTGVRRGTELALKYIDIHTIWLPSWLSTYRDNRGKSRKDFRDFSDLRPLRRDFLNLLELARPAKFWTQEWNEKKKRWTYDIDLDCLIYFLKLNGYVILRDQDSDTSIFVHIKDNIVERIRAKDVKVFLREWAEETSRPRDLRNLILNSPRTADAAFENLMSVDLDFSSSTAHSQIFHFENVYYEVTGQGIMEHSTKKSEINHYAWKENVLNHRVTLLDGEMFTISSKEEDGVRVYDIDIRDTSSPVFGYLINSSRLHWRKELEYNLDSMTKEEADAYKAAHKFDIAGEGLSVREISEQKLSLINKIFAIGYMLHKYKRESRPWAPMAMDYKIDENGVCNGRSGKSFIFKTLSKLLKTVNLSGRNRKLLDNPHVFEQVSKHTDMVLVDDCCQGFDTRDLYDNLTGPMKVNPKNNHIFEIPFEDSPKFAFTTNYVPSEFDPSSDARLLYMVFGDYYHERSESNDYLESRSIRDDFSMDLFSPGYPESCWNADINFLMQCTRFYLSISGTNIKIQPPMENIMRRKYKQDMGRNFEDWANGYFGNTEGNEHLDTMLVRTEVFEEYKRSTGMAKATMQSFTKALRAFCNLSDHVEEFNPKELCTQGNRILKKKDEVTTEMIYLRTTKVAQIERNAVINDLQTTMDFPLSDEPMPYGS